MTRELRIYLDLNKSDDSGNIPATLGTYADIERLNLPISEGVRVGVYCDDADEFGNDDYLLAEATAVFDAATQRWMFRVDEGTIRHESDDPSPERHPSEA